MRRQSLGLAVLTALLLAAPSLAEGAGKKRQSPKTAPAAGPMMRAIQLNPIDERFIELPNPDEPVRVYGSNIYGALRHYLHQTKNFAVIVGSDGKILADPATTELAARGATAAPAQAPDPCTVNALPQPSSEVQIRVAELSFTTGSRADRTFYGFTRAHANPYNAGADERLRNEFTLRALEFEPSWFGTTFSDTGGLHDGKELGHEVNFDILLAGATLKHAEYHASIGLDVEYRNRFGKSTIQRITAKGRGFYYDVSGHLLWKGVDYMAGMMLARKAALKQAFDRAVDATVQDIGSEVARLPLMGLLARECEGRQLISVGADYRVPVGQRFYDVDQLERNETPAVFTVLEVFERTASVRIEGRGFQVGDRIVSLAPNEKVPVPEAGRGLAMAALAAQDTERVLDTGRVDLNVPDLLKRFLEDPIKRFFKGLKELVTLPYRIWRFRQYDQKYRGGELWQVDPQRAASLASRSWALRAAGVPAAWQNCPTQTDCLGSRQVVVAVIDSGVDYNHRELNRNIFWDGTRNVPGWDFIANDPRPYDDHAHGTEVASVVAGGGYELVGVAPHTTIMPIRAFSPYGLTTSAALYGAFEYAVANGAHVIVAGWGTQKHSRALEDAMRIAEANGVLVVAAAGDHGEDLDRKPHYPASLGSQFSNVIVVAGYGEDGLLTHARARYSNFGKSVDLAAPGSGVRVANPRAGYKSRSHTGLAAGMVAGAASLVWSRCPGLSVQEVKDILVTTAKPLESLKGEVAENRTLSVDQSVDKTNQICK